MSRSQDRTERPTERRKREARLEGKVARSQEVGAALTLIGLVASLRFLAPGAASAAMNSTKQIIGAASTATISPAVGSGVVSMLLVTLVPFLGLALALGVAGGVAQVGVTLTPKAAKPKLSNLSLKRGLHRFKPSVFGWELVKTVLKLGLLVAVIWGPLTAWIGRLGAPLGIGEAVAMTGSQVSTLLLRAAVLASLIAGADYAVIRFRTSRELKMTRRELKDELKQVEGDPLVKQQRRRRQSELSRNRMISDVATADVVVTNPVRLAIALRYAAGEAAPRVVAKGANKLAVRIRAEAYRNGVTVVENKAVARSLYRKARVGQFVPVALYEAVATVLAVAYRRRGRKRAIA